MSFNIINNACRSGADYSFQILEFFRYILNIFVGKLLATEQHRTQKQNSWQSEHNKPIVSNVQRNKRDLT